MSKYIVLLLPFILLNLIFSNDIVGNNNQIPLISHSLTQSEIEILRNIGLNPQKILSGEDVVVEITNQELSSQNILIALEKLFKYANTTIQEVMIEGSNFKDTQILLPLTNLTRLDLERNPINYYYLPTVVNNSCQTLKKIVLTGTLAPLESCQLDQDNVTYFLNTIGTLCPTIERIYLNRLPIVLLRESQKQLFFTQLAEVINLSTRNITLQFQINNSRYEDVFPLIEQIQKKDRTILFNLSQNPLNWENKKQLKQLGQDRNINFIYKNRILRFFVGREPLSPLVIANLSHHYIKRDTKLTVFSLKKFKKECIPVK
tara:strand:- start:190 stop:1140 length:951 start_codon:yes stop_codon:yes gene_type:complete